MIGVVVRSEDVEQIDGGVIYEQVLIMAVSTKCALVLLGVLLLAGCTEVAGQPGGLRLGKSHLIDNIVTCAPLQFSY